MSEAGYAANSITADDISDRMRVARSGVVYFLRPGTDPVFFPGMSAEIVLRYQLLKSSTPLLLETRSHLCCPHVRRDGQSDQVVGVLGTVHPEVLQSYEILHPCSLLEIDIEAIM